MAATGSGTTTASTVTIAVINPQHTYQVSIVRTTDGKQYNFSSKQFVNYTEPPIRTNLVNNFLIMDSTDWVDVVYNAVFLRQKGATFYTFNLPLAYISNSALIIKDDANSSITPDYYFDSESDVIQNIEENREEGTVMIVLKKTAAIIESKVAASMSKTEQNHHRARRLY